MKTRYARAQEENDQLRANNSVLLQDGYELLARLNETRHERNDLIAMLDAANTKLEESTAALKLVNSQPILVPSNPPVDDSRLREMALSMASCLVGSGEFVTTRAQKYLDFLKGDAEPKQPPFAVGEGVFE